MEQSATVPPPPQPPSNASNSGALILAGLGGLIVALLIVLVVVLLTRDSGTEPSATSAASVTSITSVETTAATTPVETSTPVTTEAAEPAVPPLFSIEPGDVIVSGQNGVKVMRSGALVAQPLAIPTQNAMATPGGGIVYHEPFADDYPDFWPPTIPIGGPTLRVLLPDGSDDVLFAEGWRLQLFDITEIPAVAPGPSAVIVKSDLLDDFPFRSDSIVVVPLDGSAPHVISEVSGFESIVTGLAWMEGFFAVSLAGEGFEAFDAIDLAGDSVAWPTNPESADTRDPEVHVMNLTRIGDSDLLAYTRSADFSFQAPVDLVIFDSNAGVEVTSVPILVIGYDVAALSASADLVALSVVQDTGAGDWPFVHSTVAIVDTMAFIVDGIDVEGTASVVG